MSRLPPRPDLQWKDDGTPVDTRFGDVYYSVEDGLAEARAVFLGGCGLPEAWADAQTYTIAELGFGTGLNFLATWQAWQAHRRPEAWLHFVSFEGFLLDVLDVERAFAPWPELAPLAAQLCAQWPDRVKGTQHIVWPQERLTLTLHIGLIEETLPQSHFKANAWFLDGFSPAKNDQMWSDSVYPALAARSANQARVATFTVAGHVRRGLQAAGFAVEKKAGHGRKRERLEATYKTASNISPFVPAQSKKIAIIGAGIAGACLAYSLQQYGVQATVFERADKPGSGASGNPLALMMPRLDAGDTVQARLHIDAYIMAQRYYAGLPGISVCETLQRPRDAQQAKRFDKVLADPPLDLKQLEAMPQSSLLHKKSVCIQPDILLTHLLRDVDVRFGGDVVSPLTERKIGGETFDAIVLANGVDLAALSMPLGVSQRLGQVDWISDQPDVPATAIAAGHYAVAANGLRLWGATFEDVGASGVVVQQQATAENQAALKQLAPYWWQTARAGPVQSRAGVRATTADRLPLIGALPDMDALIQQRAELERRQWRHQFDDPIMPGIYVAGGFGTRGFTWAPWAARLLSAHLLGLPSPTGNSLRLAVAPARQVYRHLKRMS